MISNANPEQLEAIKNKGDVLLQAGAGSGKTFVLIEHIAYLIDDFIKDHKDPLLLKIELKHYCAKIVVMTYTKKAAGELRTRLQKRFADLKNEIEGLSEALDALNVTTIHGFCFRLIREGFFPEAPCELKLVSKFEIRKKIDLLYRRWLNQEADKLPQTFLDSIDESSNELIKSFVDIFQDPSLRRAWHEKSQGFDLNESFQESMRTIWQGLISDDLFEQLRLFTDGDAYKGKKWFDSMKSLAEKFESAPQSIIDFQLHYSFFQERLKNFRSPKKGSVENEELVLEFKEYLGFFKTFGQDINAYIENLAAINDWTKYISDLFSSINLNYDKMEGHNFADLEFITYRGIKNKKNLEQIQKSYNYFIVDEFQDTSEIQFSILKAIIGNDFKKIYCVGDKKQAIYGFRGGELSVFLNCSSLVSKNISLKNNYRSLPEIIDFNNNLFNCVMPKGEGYEGEDSMAVTFDRQTIPDSVDYNLRGSINNIQIYFKDLEEKLNTAQVSFFEAKILAKKISQISSGTSCVLYRSLTPASYLTNALSKRGIGFTCQVKIPYGDDPIIYIFCQLMQFLCERNKIDFCRKIEITLKSLKFDEMNITEALESFITRIPFIDLYTNFLIILKDLGLRITHYHDNLGFIEEMVSLFPDDYNKIFFSIKKISDENFNFFYQYGNRPDKVILMTAHGSKGLEFDHILLAGIHSNERAQPMRSDLGKYPGSFKWRNSEILSEAIDTPQFIAEKIIRKKREFSEAKRLFYVACTRAKESLSWVSFDHNPKFISSNKNSWINAIHRCAPADLVNIEICEESLSHSSTDNFEMELPIYQKEDLGFRQLEVRQDNLALITDLSVTRLALVEDCPRKFYYKNICRFEEKDFEKKKMATHKIENEISGNSSIERGLEVHDELSKLIKNNLILPLSLKGSKNKNILEWVGQELLAFKEDGFLMKSEIELKFPFFSQILSGTPDLFMISHERNAVEVWDFKTGRRNEETEKKYWFQVASYIFGCVNLGLVHSSSKLSGSLVYVDNKVIERKEFTFEELEEYLFESWNKVSRPHEQNLRHCESCPYGNLCHF